MPGDIQLSIVIPCYNESQNIPALIKRIDECAFSEDVEFILVDNGSSDNTRETLDTNLEKHPRIRAVFLDKNQGYGGGILWGLQQAHGRFVGWSHADLQTDPSDIKKAYEMLQDKQWDESLYLKGERYGRSLGENFFTAGMTAFETLYLGKYLNDINAQPNIFHRSFFEKLQSPPTDFSWDLFFFFKAKNMGLKVIRFPVFFGKRLYGASKWNFGFQSRLRFIKRTIDFSRKLKRDLTAS